MIESYIRSLKNILITHPEVKSWKTISEEITLQTGIIRIGAALADKSKLYLFEYLMLEKGNLVKMKYSYHWQSAQGLIIRWDNAKHHRDIPTFPDHLHFGDEVKPSKQIGVIEILRRISE